MAKNEITTKLTVRDFFKRFPNEDACLEHVMVVRFGLRHICRKCDVESTFHKLELRKAYCCATCGDHLYPCSGTIFQDSRTPLQLWFYAIYLFVASRHGVSGMELHRQLGVSRKCAHRIARQIRTLMTKANGADEMLSGHIEVDEVYLRGSRRGIGSGNYRTGSTIVLGLKERDGRLVTKIIPAARTSVIREILERQIAPGSTVSTDQSNAYLLVKHGGWTHFSVNHGRKEYARRDPETGESIHVNSLENFWGLFQASVRGTHIHISPEYTDKYLGEFTYRANHRAMGNSMFDALISAL